MLADVICAADQIGTFRHSEWRKPAAHALRVAGFGNGAHRDAQAGLACRQRLRHRPTVFRRREELWERLAQRLDPDRPIVALEFGVAWGYATAWWLRRLRGRDVVWHGFDRFTGLPRAWREYAQGAFDAGGKPPPIDDERVRWHVGDVQDTLRAVDLAAARDAQWLILFDLDIYEPNAFAWEAISAHLRPGDLVYFDEAMDIDERRVLNEMIMPSIDCQPVGTTALGLGLTVTRPIPRN